jgi:hypothetical protein
MTTHLELLRQTDIFLSMLLSEILDPGMRKQADQLLKSIEVETRNGASGEDQPTPLIEFGVGWAKIHFKREVTERDRANLTAALAAMR